MDAGISSIRIAETNAFILLSVFLIIVYINKAKNLLGIILQETSGRKEDLLVSLNPRTKDYLKKKAIGLYCCIALISVLYSTKIIL